MKKTLKVGENLFQRSRIKRNTEVKEEQEGGVRDICDSIENP